MNTFLFALIFMIVAAVVGFILYPLNGFNWAKDKIIETYRDSQNGGSYRRRIKSRRHK
jgi:hypothetical protein